MRLENKYDKMVTTMPLEWSERGFKVVIFLSDSGVFLSFFLKPFWGIHYFKKRRHKSRNQRQTWLHKNSSAY